MICENLKDTFMVGFHWVMIVEVKVDSNHIFANHGNPPISCVICANNIP